MVMWNLKSCPRCGGDAFTDKDQYGWYEQCLQCSYRFDLKELSEFKKRLFGSPEKREEVYPDSAG